MSDDARAALEIELFGPLRVCVEGEPLPPLRSRKGQWLLALLALRSGREVGRDWLAETLWPDALPDDALNSLRQTLHDLRRTLGPASRHLAAPHSRVLAVDPQHARIDVVEFDAAVRRGDPESLAAGVALYRGPLLEGCVEPWVLGEREEREAAYLRALGTLAARATAAGDPAEAVRLLRLGAAASPFQESVHRDLMEARARAGEHAAALEVYQELRRRLFREHHAEPDPRTTDVYRRIRDEARSRADSPTAKPAPAPGAIPHPLTRAPIHPYTPPAPSSEIVGRETDLRAVHERLLTGRLVALTGPGGVGKTQLSLEVAGDCAAEFADGAVFVDLSPLSEGGAVPDTVAAALGLPEETWTRGPAPAEDRLAAALRSRQLLLVLDNCEQVLEGAAALASRLIAGCSGVRVLATSRERLGIVGENVWPVEPLALPPETDSPSQATADSPAVRLFMERARAVCPSLPEDAATTTAVGRICRRLDGLPLALELAAALADVLSLNEIAAGLNDRFALLAGGERDRPIRHQSLRAVIDWSWQRLSPEEQGLLRRIAEYSGRFSTEAAEAMSLREDEWERGRMGEGQTSSPRSAPTIPYSPSPTPHRPRTHPLAQLVRKSLVVRDSAPGPAPFRLLETVREYAAERLREYGEADWARERHLEYAVRLAEQAEAGLTGPEQAAWLTRLDAEYDHLRDLLVSPKSKAVGGQGAGDGSQLSAFDNHSGGVPSPGGATVVSQGWSTAEPLEREAGKPGGAPEGRQTATGIPPSGPPPAGSVGEVTSTHPLTRSPAHVLHLTAGLGRYWQIRGMFSEGRRFLEGAIADAGSGTAPDELRVRARGLGWAGFLAIYQGDYPSAHRLAEQSLALARDQLDAESEAAALGSLALLATYQGDDDRALALFERSLAQYEATGSSSGVASSLGYLGILAANRRDDSAARELYQKALVLRRELGDRWGIAASLNNLGLLALRQGDLAEARPLLEESLALRRELGDRRCIAVTLNLLGQLAEREGDPKAARECYAESLQLAVEIGDRRSLAYSLEAFARLHAAADPERSARLCGAAEALREAIGAPLSSAEEPHYAKLAAALESALGTPTFHAARAAGRTTPPEAASRLAVSSPGV